MAGHCGIGVPQPKMLKIPCTQQRTPSPSNQHSNWRTMPRVCMARVQHICSTLWPMPQTTGKSCIQQPAVADGTAPWGRMAELAARGWLEAWWQPSKRAATAASTPRRHIWPPAVDPGDGCAVLCEYAATHVNQMMRCEVYPWLQ